MSDGGGGWKPEYEWFLFVERAKEMGNPPRHKLLKMEGKGQSEPHGGRICRKAYVAALVGPTAAGGDAFLGSCSLRSRLERSMVV